MIPAIPTTPTAAAAAALAAEACPPFLLNHSYRTYCFGRMLVPVPDLDEEAAFVAAMIHDLGLTEAHAAEAGFEQVSADAAARFLETRGWEPERIQLVEQAIIRHTNLAPNDTPEHLVVQAGAALDVAGIPGSDLHASTTRQILERYPRLDFVESMRSLYLSEIEKTPEGVFAELESKLQLSELITHNPLDQI